MITIFQPYKRTFDYKGISSQREFNLFLGTHLLLCPVVSLILFILEDIITEINDEGRFASRDIVIRICQDASYRGLLGYFWLCSRFLLEDYVMRGELCGGYYVCYLSQEPSLSLFSSAQFQRLIPRVLNINKIKEIYHEKSTNNSFFNSIIV